jgi:hypothetical protein
MILSANVAQVCRRVPGQRLTPNPPAIITRQLSPAAALDNLPPGFSIRYETGAYCVFYGKQMIGWANDRDNCEPIIERYLDELAEEARQQRLGAARDYLWEKKRNHY